VYKVELRLRLQKSLDNLPTPDRIKLLKLLETLEKNPRPAGVEKVRGAELWRIREGRYRIVYAIDDKEQLVTIV
jgi:mRNA interferase RelE/StbE